ncbi:unnamed protein product, partial [Urochloa humidicola]
SLSPHAPSFSHHSPSLEQVTTMLELPRPSPLPQICSFFLPPDLLVLELQLAAATRISPRLGLRLRSSVRGRREHRWCRPSCGSSGVLRPLLKARWRTCGAPPDASLQLARLGGPDKSLCSRILDKELQGGAIGLL